MGYSCLLRGPGLSGKMLFINQNGTGIRERTIRLTSLSLLHKLSLLWLITDIWSHFSAPSAAVLLQIFISQPGSQLMRSECSVFQSSGIFRPLSPPLNFPSLPGYFNTLLAIKDNTWCSPLSFPVVSLPISPSETSLPFGSPAFELKKIWSSLYCVLPCFTLPLSKFMHVWICESMKERNRKKDRRGIFNPITRNSSLL